jgi:hypothetical protein
MRLIVRELLSHSDNDPEHFVILTDQEAEQLEEDNLLLRRKIQDHANRVLIKHGGVNCVPFYDLRGKSLKVISVRA